MNLFCVQCKNPLARNQSKCQTCGASFAIHSEYIDYLPENNFYWGELTKEEMQTLNAQAAGSKGYRRACFDYFRNHPRKDLFEYMLNGVGRTAFINFIYRVSHSERCLDLGSGLGAIPAALSKLFNEVYSIELVKERVEFQILRKKQDGIGNWTIIKGAVDRLPFPDNYFDFVSANGMLEWAAVANFTDSPQKVQLNFIKEIKRVLKPEGVCYIGIENRTGIQYWRGALDHSGIKYTSLIPRFLANFACYLKQKKNNFHFDKAQGTVGARYYRVYIYTKNQYKKLLKEAGIENVRIFHTNFTYNLAYAGIDDKAVSAIPRGRDVIKHKLTQFKHATNRFRAWFFSLLTPNFLIFFSKEEGRLTSDFEDKIQSQFADAGPFYVYRGFNNLLAYSIPRETFYKTPSLSLKPIVSEKKALGEISTVMTPELFRAVLNVLRKKYHTEPTASPEKLREFTKWIVTRATPYTLPTKKLQAHLDSLQKKYATTALFAKTHGDVWLGNIFKSGDTIELIDEERDQFNLVPLELLRFLLSVVGYHMHDRQKPEYSAYMKEIESIYGGSVTQDMLEDFYLSTLFYELARRDLLGDSPRKELFYFYDCIKTALDTNHTSKTT